MDHLVELVLGRLVEDQKGGETLLVAQLLEFLVGVEELPEEVDRDSEELALGFGLELDH